MIHVGDCRSILPTLEADSVQCVVTSPPYLGLRDYGVDGQIGLEEFPDCLGWATGAECGKCFVCELVGVFRHVRRVLKADGVCWINLGDSYAGSGRGGSPGGASSTLAGLQPEHAMVKRSRDDVSSSKRKHSHPAGGCRLPAGLHAEQVEAGATGRAWVPAPKGWKQKDLMGMPWRVALALQADGWYLRQDVIWHKPNPMPESVTDRCTKAHEYLFMLTKSAKYYFDATAVSEPMAPASINRLAQNVEAQRGSDRVPGKTNGAMKAVSRPENAERISASRDKYREAGLPDGPGMTRNRRSVWTVPTVPFKEAHFATYPEKLIEPCILASTRPGDMVLDPFLGAGTTALVADRLGRRWTGCELNPEYVDIARARLLVGQPGLPLDSAA